MNNIKVAVIGLNGIGSYFVRGLSELIKRDIQGFNKINAMAIDLFDFDTIEEKNLLYTTYDIEHIGENKAEVLESITSFRGIAKKITDKKQLENYDLIILAVDNNEVRNIVYNSNIPFLDLRAKGKTIMAFVTQKEVDTKNEYPELTKNDGQKGGCQYQKDIEERNIQLGNRIIAEIGLQMLKEYLQEDITHKQKILVI